MRQSARRGADNGVRCAHRIGSHEVANHETRAGIDTGQTFAVSSIMYMHDASGPPTVGKMTIGQTEP